MSSIDKLKNRINTKYKLLSIFFTNVSSDIVNNSKDNPYIGFYLSSLRIMKGYPNLRNHGKRVRKFIYIDFDTNTRYTFYIMVLRVKDINTDKVCDLLPNGVKPCCNYIFDTIKLMIDFIKNKRYTKAYIINEVLAFINHLPNEKSNCDHDIIYYWLSKIKRKDSFFYLSYIKCEMNNNLI